MQASYISATEAARKWDVSLRQVQRLTAAGRIAGAKKLGHNWIIPADAEKPQDFRKEKLGTQKRESSACATQTQRQKAQERQAHEQGQEERPSRMRRQGGRELQSQGVPEVRETQMPRESQAHGEVEPQQNAPDLQEPRKDLACPLPYSTPNFLLSTFYSTPGTADSLAESLMSDEAKLLCTALLAYYRGHDKEAEDIAEKLLAKGCCFETQIGCALLLATCSLYSGSLQSWNRARARLMALRRKQPDSTALTITETALSGVLYMREAPEWLETGCFSDFSPVCYPALYYIYAKWLLMQKHYNGLLAAVGPMIATVHTAGSLLSELYLHIIAGAAYRIADDEARAVAHIEAALDLALPDELYGVLAEYRRQLGTPLDDALKRRDQAAFVKVKDTYERLAKGFTVLHNAITGNRLTNELTLREYEIATLALRGECNADIATRMGITVGSVKGYFNAIYQKLGAGSRSDLGQYIL